ncbi:hypothetical protein [Spiroplasma melliferum]|uniref:Transmembrane protein n=2 Tax=Spiroplasma melliferum TaxID=2134 RepID=A0AAI9T4H2_SPIME|nr:hypothetical protein [Spiroplasma melliferum]KAI93104.1 hypothetical protein SPM_000240 [Spiroplasma melliferum KC3]QCO24132.1 putative transmembrane protein [Spiroplasma melliferum]
MNLKYNNFYHKFLSFFLLALLFYVFFFWGIGIIYPVNNFVFDNVLFNLAYVVLISFASIFVVGILTQILINFRFYQQSFDHYKLLLKTNWFVLLTWLLNLILLTITLAYNFQRYIVLVQNQHLARIPYLILLNLFYIFYLIIGLSLLLTIALVIIYGFYLKKITCFVIWTNTEIYNELFINNFTVDLFAAMIRFLQQMNIVVIIKSLICRTFLKAQLRKTKLLIQFKKENCPPLFGL